MDIGRESSCQSHPVLQVFWTPSTPANPDFSDPKTYCQNDMKSFFMDNMWNGIPTIPCSDLLALADAAITTTKVSSGIGGGDNQSNMQLVNQNSQSLSPDGTKYLFDLNSPPLPTEPETITTSSPQLTPKTPKQTTITDLEQPELINEEMEDDVWELEVNQDFEEESNDEITLKKTPQPKQKRRKHRPKVVIEGRPKSAKKAMNSSMKKRKYVRKITPEKTTSEANDPIRQTRNSCRRKINFEEEQESFGQVTEKKTQVDVTIPITPNKSETPEKGTKHTWSRTKRNLNFSQGQNGPNCNTNACFSEGRGSKRQFSDNNGSIPGLHFPTIFKKKRTEKCRRSVTPRAVSSFWFPDSFRVLRIKARERSMTYGVKNQKPYKRMWELGHVGSFRKKRSKGVKRMRDLASLTWPEYRGFTCMEALAADLNVNIATKKRTKRNSLVPYHNHWLLTNHIGFGWKTAYDVHALINQFEDLDINNERVEQNRHALVPYLTRYREKNAIVLYKQNRSLVPFEESYNPLKRRKPRPKVDLDEETSRVWRLLLEDINSKGIDGTDEDKTKWWEEERNVFRGRAVSFIARMHLVQGDRRFSRWKGSVVDSVTGVFLTQNVSDHLSSSAFMSLASRYPLKSNNNHEPLHKEPSQFNLEETITCHEHNPHKKLAQDLSSMTLQNTDSCEESNEYIDSNSFEVISCDHSESELSGISTESASKEPSKQDIFSENLKTIIDQQTHENNLDVQNFSEVISSKIDSNEDGNLEKRVSRIKVKKGKMGMGKGKRKKVDWDSLRVRAQENCKRERTLDAMDSLDYEAVRCADVNEIADVIKDRGMNNMLAERIKEFLNRLVKDHGSIDLEWLRDVPPDKAKEYLLSFRGLGLKSVECVRLLTLHHLAFPVDTNVGRIAVRLGWVPLQPLPESLQLHLLELYPVLESIQKYLWPRLCKLDQRTLYELHYQMITFGKVFCTKNKPNCNACPMRGECRHFASAFASARLSLPSPEEKSIVTTTENETPTGITNHHHLTLPEHHHTPPESELKNEDPVIEQPPSPEPIVEVPATPEPEQMQEFDLEDFGEEEEEEIPTIRLNMEAFTQNLQTYMENNTELAEGDVSKALVALTSEAASIPTPKLKNVSQLRTEHQVYELPDSHPLLEGLDTREPDDPCSYLLAIWTPGETSESIQPPEGQCSSQESGTLCHKKTCFLCNSIREANTQTVRGTLLIPCRTAMRGSFPLNGTYFQVNEVFADHESSLNPIDVPRSWLWNLPRRTVYFGTSIPTIFRGLTTQGIQYCFWRGFVCVRGFDQKTRAPRPLMARLHFPVSKLKRSRGKFDEND